MVKKEYINRYGDKYTFTQTEDGNILWEGSFEWCRFGWPNVYEKAYESYCSDISEEERLDISKFRKELHSAEYGEDGSYIGPNKLWSKYGSLVHSDVSKISMVDPSGGPYISASTPADTLIAGMEGTVSEFKRIDSGYMIIIK